MSKIANLEGTVHLLYRGTNGKPTYGISVRAIGRVEDVEKRGLRRTWDINDYEIINNDGWQDTLGLTDGEVMTIRTQVVQALLTDSERHRWMVLVSETAK